MASLTGYSVKISIDENDTKRLAELIEQHKLIAGEINHILKNLNFKSELVETKE